MKNVGRWLAARLDISGRRMVGVALVGGLMAVGLFYAVVGREEALQAAHMEAQFERLTEARVVAIDDQFEQGNAAIDALANLFNASIEVEEHEFGAFGLSLRSLNPEISALAWVERVPVAERGEWERHTGLTVTSPDDRVAPLAGEGDQLLVRYLDSALETMLIPGLDLSGDPRFAQVLAGLSSAQPKHAVVAGWPPAAPGDVNGFAVIEAVYSHTGRPQLMGYVVGVFRLRELIDEALSGMKPAGIDLWLLDGHGVVLDVHVSRLRAEGSQALLPAATALQVQAPLSLWGWKIVAAPAPGFFVPSPPRTAWIVLAVLLALISLAVGHFGATIQHARQSAETAMRLRRLNRTHAVVSACNAALVHARDETELLQSFCDRLVEIGGYPHASVERTGDEEAQSLVEAWATGVVPEAAPLAQDPESREVLSRGVVVCDLTAGNPCGPGWREVALRREWSSLLSLPLHQDGRLLGQLRIVANGEEAFDREETALLTELAADLAFGIHALRTRVARGRAESLLHILDRAVEAAENGIMICDAASPGLPLIYVNAAFERITGYPRDEVLGRNPGFLHGKDHDQAGLVEVKSALRQRREGVALLRNFRKDGTLFWNELHVAPVEGEAGDVSHFIGIINEVTDRKRYEEQLEVQANFDLLTGLPNRNLLRDRIHQTFAYVERHGNLAALIFLDIDRFRLINESLGHDAGDELLRHVAGCLSAAMREGDTLARLGGDEFVVVLHELGGEDQVTAFVQRLLVVVAEPLQRDGHELCVTASAGISLIPRDGRDAESLLKNAEVAMRRAKDEGPGSFLYYTESFNRRLTERLTLESELRRAVERGDLTLHYQPLVDLHTGRIVGVEALSRWHHPELGDIPPQRFIPLAEESGLIHPLAERAFSCAMEQISTWDRMGRSDLRIALNLSARQLVMEGMVSSLDGLLKRHAVAAGRVELELTENCLAGDSKAMGRRLAELKELGVRLVLDDFGTGWSSLNLVKRHPIDKLKIDHSFVRDLTTVPDDAAIALAIVAMAHSLRMTVVAEGVETEGQWRYLRRHGCDEAQGFYFSKPCAADELTPLLVAPDLPLVDGTSGERDEEPPTVMVIDDEVNITRSLVRLLRRDGYRVLTANTPTEAFDLLARHRVQVVISDQRMPEMSGTDLLNRVKELHPETVRILLTGYTELNTVTEAVNRGWLYKFLTKPWNDDELRAHVRDAFRLHEAQKG